jgi:Sodium/hydrogen exchanger family
VCVCVCVREESSTTVMTIKMSRRHDDTSRNLPFFLFQITLLIVWMTTNITSCLANAETEFHCVEAIARALSEKGVANNTENADLGHEEEEEELEEPYAVLYPSLILVFGTLIFYGSTRFVSFLPYTGCMFLLGTFMGLGVSVRDHNGHPATSNAIHQTVLLWQGINSEVLLLVFLPGLIFKDSLGQNVNLFQRSFGQLFIFAFPMVLGGTLLTALVGFYVLPYDWSFNLCMTFGSILSATDPVAVAALLEQVGKKNGILY